MIRYPEVMTGAISIPGLVAPQPQAQGVSFAEAFSVWLRIALLSFGAPAGQIAVMHCILVLVDEKRWVSESRFLHALNYCMLPPDGRPSSSPSISAG
jgi:chromate transporter